ncbi:MAG: TrkH family potassium uptake protein [Cellulosilyticaceae bacterium]
MRTTRDQIKMMAYYLGKIILGTGVLLIIPIITALVTREWEPLLEFVISFNLFMLIGGGLEWLGRGFKGQVKWMHGMLIASSAWLILMGLSAIPYYMSGHYLSYLDAMFDVMSGFTTTGLGLIQDLDHVSHTLNMWRHLITFVGGQGMVVLALSFLITKGEGVVCMYVGEAKDEKLLPNVADTTKAIWEISLVYLAIGTLALTIAGKVIGMSSGRSFLHGLWIFMGAWSTGGFAPQSQNILYYHSGLYECVTIVFLIIGSFNFALHHAIWKGNRKEIYKNIEMVSFMVTLTLTTSIASYYISKMGLYSDGIAMFRKVFYQMVSAHTTTGFMNVYAQEFLKEWGTMGILMISTAMLIGGSATSTAGGIKGIRMGILVKALGQNIKKLVSPANRISVSKYHFGKQNVLTDEMIKNTLLIITLYLLTFGVGVVATVMGGYSLEAAIFESASVTGNVGLTIGVTSPAMPAALKVVYILMMWAARLEFISAFALIWKFASEVKGVCGKVVKKRI